jgi:hypothetical protein
MILGVLLLFWIFAQLITRPMTPPKRTALEGHSRRGIECPALATLDLGEPYQRSWFNESRRPPWTRMVS